MADQLTGKLRVTFKCPDAISDAIEEFLDQQKCPDGINEEEWETIRDHRRDRLRDRCNKWFEYGQYVFLELDLETDSCTVRR